MCRKTDIYLTTWIKHTRVPYSLFSILNAFVSGILQFLGNLFIFDILVFFFYGKLFSTGSLKLKRKVHPDINLSILIGTNLSNICQYFNDCIILSTWVILFEIWWLLVISLSVNCSSPYWKLGISRLFLKAFE